MQFTFDILEECNQNDLDNKEKYWIDYYDTYNQGYNCTLGGRDCDLYIQNQYKNLINGFDSSDDVVLYLCDFEDAIEDIFDENIKNMTVEEIFDYYDGMETILHDFCGGYNSFDDWAECNL